MSRWSRRCGLAVLSIGFLAIGFLAGLYVARHGHVPFVRRETEWAIGIYRGTSPSRFIPHEDVSNPVLTAKDVTDVDALFVADPFMVKHDSRWYMFFEVMNRKTGQGDIGLATSDDGLRWTYEKVVLDEPFHLSYPYVFRWNNEYYMIPETNAACAIRLYRAVEFPTSWTFVRIMLRGHYVDPSIFRHGGKWWLFAGERSNDILRLYCSDELMGPFREHPRSPIVSADFNIARPGGRVLADGDRIIRFTQDDEPTYGNQVRAFQITELTPLLYEERELPGNPVLGPTGTGWNAEGMHHIDAHRLGANQWIACVDGWRNVVISGRGD